jgi:hypothetical protein
MAKWWVNDPNGASVHYPTKQQAQKVAKQVKDATVSKGEAVGGKHRDDGWGCAVTAVALIGGLLTILGSAGYGVAQFFS